MSGFAILDYSIQNLKSQIPSPQSPVPNPQSLDIIVSTQRVAKLADEQMVDALSVYRAWR
ncbi:hypothetical protein [Anabaena sp. UHCC 0399]|uniref:hypothetical protein n=1 Tax=Anabaena sp. UHCC 0399 TaxID=3110238 RepID=UPI0016823F56|nr:hypothetical protein [Anabaena sp. UHCC 0399]MBD2363271.1 hypothetical protein [Anabaena minutissima FACHB-250]MEA5568912.1 hypothetical protein [Anabaena sp. UHCC 0399]